MSEMLINVEGYLSDVKPGDTLYFATSEEEAGAAMLVEMKSARKHHEEAVLKLAAEMATHTEEMEHLDCLLDRYENDNKETNK